MKIITTIVNFDENKSYPNIVKTKSIPVYPTKCPCNYGYLCDDPNFDYNKPIRYVEVSKDDKQDKLFDS